MTRVSHWPEGLCIDDKERGKCEMGITVHSTLLIRTRQDDKVPNVPFQHPIEAGHVLPLVHRACIEMIDIKVQSSTQKEKNPCNRTSLNCAMNLEDKTKRYQMYRQKQCLLVCS